MIRKITKGLLLFAAVSVVLVNAEPAFALGPYAPDPADYTAITPSATDPNIGKGWFVLAHIENNIQVDQTNVKVYFADNIGTKQIRIHHGDLCSGPGEDYDNYYNVATPNASGQIARYDVLKVALTPDATNPTNESPTGTVLGSAFGYKNATGGPTTCGEKIISIPGSELVYSPLMERYVAFVRANRLGTYGVNQFQVEAVGGVAGLAGKEKFGIQTIGFDDTYTNASIPFGPDCTLKSAAFAPIQILDPDNGVSGINPLMFNFKVFKKTGGGAWQQLTAAEYANPQFLNGNATDGWEPPRMNTTTQVSQIDVRFQPGYSYEWRIYNMFDRNNFEFIIPYDQIYHSIPCEIIQPYSLVPHVTSQPNDVAVPPETVDFDFFIDNQSQNAGETRWSILILTGNNQAIYRNENQGPVSVPAGQRIQVDPSNWQRASSIDWGGKICARLIIHQADDTGREDFDEQCISIGKQPHVQIRNGDTWIGGSYPEADGSCPVSTDTADAIGFGSNTIGGTTFGNWTEYGLMVLGDIDGFGSAGQPRSTSGGGSSLSFANQPPAFGHYYGPADTVDRCVTDMFARYGNRASTALNGDTTNINNLGTGVYRATIGDTLTINSTGQIGPNRDIIILAHNVVINGDIVFQDRFNSIGEIPRIIILATGTITINADVTRVDSWLISKEELYTCQVTERLTTNLCNKQLRVNGPVIAKEIVLRRTFGGSTPNAAEPAEIFNLRTDAIFKAYLESLGAGKQETQFIMELPPRY